MKTHTTDEVNYNKFKPHGSVTFSVVDRKIIEYRASGPFNREFINALEKIEPEVLNAVKKDVEIWGEIVIFEDSCMALDEFFDEFCVYLKDLKKNNLIALANAYVFPNDVEGVSFMHERYEKCYKDAGLIISIFNNEEEAFFWVKSFFE